MPTSSDLLDTLLRLGDQIAEAMDGDDWSRLPDLVAERAEVVEQLHDLEVERRANGARPPKQHAEKIDALAEQYRQLMTVLEDRRDQIRDELAHVEQLKQAQDSYEGTSTRRQILSPNLQG